MAALSASLLMHPLVIAIRLDPSDFTLDFGLYFTLDPSDLTNNQLQSFSNLNARTVTLSLNSILYEVKGLSDHSKLVVIPISAIVCKCVLILCCSNSQNFLCF